MNRLPYDISNHSPFSSLIEERFKVSSSFFAFSSSSGFSSPKNSLDSTEGNILDLVAGRPPREVLSRVTDDYFRATQTGWVTAFK